MLFPRKGGQSNAHGFLKLKGTANFELDWLTMVLANSRD
jgi:hypothetical protein